LDLLLVSPFVGLGDPEVNGHYHALMRPSARLQGRPGGQRSLGVNNAIADFAEAPAQRVAEKHLVPMPGPGNAGGSAASLQNETEAENGYCERPTPRERREERGGHTTFLEIPPELPDVRVNARDAFLPVHCGDH